jgi:hypothetical protein
MLMFLRSPRRCFLLGIVFSLAGAPLVPTEHSAAATLHLPSLAALWDVTAATDLGPNPYLADLSGQGWQLQFGASTPPLAFNQFSRGYLDFQDVTASPLTTGNLFGQQFFDGAISGQPWALAVGLRLPDIGPSTVFGTVLSDSNQTLALRALNDDVDLQIRFPDGNPPGSVQNLPATSGDNLLVVVRHDGQTRSIEVISDTTSWGSAALSKAIPYDYDQIPLSAVASGDLILNPSQTSFGFYGAAYLDNPSEADVSELKAWGARQWLLQGRDRALLFEGDSTVEVGNAFPDRVPGWAQVLTADSLDPTRVLSQNFASGGARAIANTQFENGLADSPLAEIWDFYVEWLDSAGVDIYAPIVMGTNDVGADGATPEEVIAALETWATRTAAAGGQPLWVGILDTQGDAIDQGRTAVNLGVRQRFLDGQNDFAGLLDALREDPAWGWGFNVNQTAPQFMADATHPNTAGNADIAAKLAPAVLRLLAIPGDFDGNWIVDAADIDLLAANAGSSDLWFDLDGDGVVTFAIGATGITSDSDFLIRTILQTEYGDANLDGVVGAADVSALSGGFGTAAGWAGGDFNGDGLVGPADVSVLSGFFGFEGGSEESGNPVPEPTAGWLLAMAALLVTAARRYSPGTAQRRPAYHCVLAALVLAATSHVPDAAATLAWNLREVPGGTTNGSNYIAFDLVVSGAAIGTFDTFELRIESIVGAGLVPDLATPNSAGTFEGDNDSGFSIGLVTSPIFFPGGLDLDEFGVQEGSSLLMSGTFASIGDNSVSNLGTTFAAQIVLPAGIAGSFGNYSSTFFDNGSLVAERSGSWGNPAAIPEASAPLACAVAGLLTAAFHGRRRVRKPLLSQRAERHEVG